jgi:ParB family chromosome partitioning protein
MFRSVPVSAIQVGERMRKLDMAKVDELAESFSNCGQINPISLDTEYNLITGNHRVAAAKKLGWEDIQAQVLDADALMQQLQEVDENLVRSELCYISTGEHIAKRERILTALGKRTKRGDNRYTLEEKEEVFSTDALAERIGVSNRVYRLRRQVSNLTPVVRNALRGTSHANNLVDLVLLSRMEDSIQERVAEIANESNSRSLKWMIDKAKIEQYTDKERTKLVEEIKNKYGVPYAMMKFDRKDHVLQKIVSSVSDRCRNKKAGHLRGREYSNYNGFPEHSVYLLDYYVRRKEARVLDNFMGKGVNVLSGLFLDMKVVGFDLKPEHCDAIYEACDEYFPNGKYEFFNEDGVAMKPLQDENESFDAVLTDPPYLNCAEAYTEEENDLSNVSIHQFLELMEQCFVNYHRIIKTSNIDEKCFYPVMMKMNSSRAGKKGVISMDFEISKIAEKVGFTLWDRTFNHLNSASAMVITPRCYDNYYSVKNWETTLCWIKQ